MTLRTWNYNNATTPKTRDSIIRELVIALSFWLELFSCPLLLPRLTLVVSGFSLRCTSWYLVVGLPGFVLTFEFTPCPPLLWLCQQKRYFLSFLWDQGSCYWVDFNRNDNEILFHFTLIWDLISFYPDLRQLIRGRWNFLCPVMPR